MNQFAEIQKKILNLNSNYKVEEVELENALGRILQEDILADMDMPPFNKSAMDGYACRISDIENELEVLEIISAGKVPTKVVSKNQCSKIMTGACVPDGANCVFKVEESVKIANNKVRCTNKKTNINICYRAEDYKMGTVLIQEGTVVNTSQLAVLAGAGYSRVKVSALPKVALIATGSELVEPGEKPQKGKIRNSNASQLSSQLKKIGINTNYLGIAEDDFDKISQLFTTALENNDYVFFTGGASMGDFDWIPVILRKQGFTIFWDRTGIKPGNPMTFAQKGNKYCFGLSGNPVSSLVQFELIAKPIIYKLLGAKYKPFRFKTYMASDYRRKKNNRLAIVPVFINDEGLAETILFNGSAHINALVNANALLEVQEGKSEIKKGDLVYVRPL